MSELARQVRRERWTHGLRIPNAVLVGNPDKGYLELIVEAALELADKEQEALIRQAIRLRKDLRAWREAAYAQAVIRFGRRHGKNFQQEVFKALVEARRDMANLLTNDESDDTVMECLRILEHAVGLVEPVEPTKVTP